MKKTTLAAAMGAIAALGLASHASAANVYTTTFQGTVAGTDTGGAVYDSANLFGGGNLAGDAITAVVTYDVTLGTDTTTSTTDQRVGGIDYGVTDPIISEMFTINGDSYTFTPDYQAILYTKSGSSGYVQDTANSTAGDGSIIKLSTATAPNSLTTLFTSTGTGTGYLDTAFGKNNTSDTITFNTTSVTVAAGGVSAAPEPSTWALMIAGVGIMGLALRRRRANWSPTLAA